MTFATRFLVGIATSAVLLLLPLPSDVLSARSPDTWPLLHRLRQSRGKQSLSATTRDILLGLLIPYQLHDGEIISTFESGRYFASAISMAVEDVNKRPDLLPNHKLKFVWNDTSCEKETTIKQLMYQATAKPPADAIIGPGCYCKTAARKAAAMNIPMLSYMCRDPELSNKKVYGTFARTCVFAEQLAPSLIALLQKYNWNRVAIITEESNLWETISEQVVREFAKNGIKVAYRNTVTKPNRYWHKYDGPKFAQIMKDIKANARIVIYLCDLSVAREGMLAAYNNGMIDGQYAFIMSELTPRDLQLKYKAPFHWFSAHYIETVKFSSQVKKAYEAVLVIAVNKRQITNNERFQAEMKRRMKDPPFLSDEYTGFLPHTKVPKSRTVPPPYGAYLYDAVYFYALALNKTISKGQDIRNGRAVFENLRNTMYKSINGYQIYMDKNGDVQADMTLLDLRKDGSAKGPEMVEVGDFRVTSVQRGQRKLELKLRENSKIKWPVTNQAPKDTPVHGFQRRGYHLRG